LIRYALSLLIVTIVCTPNLLPQAYATSPFYQKGQNGAVSVSQHWHAPVNGVSVEISLSLPKPGPWKDGMKVDGAPSKQVIHYFLQDNYHHVRFGYDLVVQAVAGTQQIICTFSSLTYRFLGAFEESLPEAPLSGSLPPLSVNSGDTIVIGMFSDPERSEEAFQYIHIELVSSTKNP